VGSMRQDFERRVRLLITRPGREGTLVGFVIWGENAYRLDEYVVFDRFRNFTFLVFLSFPCCVSVPAQSVRCSRVKRKIQSHKFGIAKHGRNQRE
jgi:hypothetical protein